MSESRILPDPEHCSFGRVVYPRGGTFGPRRQTLVQLVLIVRGSARIRVDGRLFDLAAGEVSLMHPGHDEHYQFDRRRETEHTWAHLEWSVLPAAVAALLRRLPRKVATPANLTAMIDAGVAMHRQRGVDAHPAHRKLAAACLLEFATAAAPGVLADDPAAPLPEPLQQAIACIEQRLDQPLDNAALAAAAGVTRSHLIRLFRTHLGETPMRYLWRQRVRRGADLLAGTGLSVSEVAYRVGFASPHHFARRVRQQTGRTPRELRHRAWGRVRA